MSLKQLLKATMPAFLPMDKPVQERHIVWWVPLTIKAWYHASVKACSLECTIVKEMGLHIEQRSAFWRFTMSVLETSYDPLWREGRSIHWKSENTPRKVLMYKVRVLWKIQDYLNLPLKMKGQKKGYNIILKNYEAALFFSLLRKFCLACQFTGIVVSSEHKKSKVDFFVMSVTLFKTSVLAAFVNEIKVSFLLLVKYHVRDICSNFK